jgi:site-specific recombinase XerD
MKKTVDNYHNYMRKFHAEADCFSDEYLFYIVRDGLKRPMSDDNVAKFMKAYGLSARQTCLEVPDNVHAHLWRHSRAMHLYQHGMDLTLISQWLGHVQLDTTLIYSHADTEQKRKAIEQSTDLQNPLVSKDSFLRYQVDDEEMLKKLYGLK